MVLLKSVHTVAGNRGREGHLSQNQGPRLEKLLLLHLHSVHIWKILAGTERLEPHFCVSVAVSSAECECLLLCFKAIKQAGCIPQLGACHLGSTCISLQLVLKEKEHAFFNHAGVHILPDIPKAT